MSYFINRDGFAEAWNGDTYVPLGSMQDFEVPKKVDPVKPRRSGLYIVIEEYPAFTIDEFQRIARDQREQRRRRVRFRKLLQTAAKLAARRAGADS